MDNALASMTLAQFAAQVRPSGGINRYTLPGTDIDVHSWSVYMNGPFAEQLPASAREHEFKDVMVNALTEKLGLDSGSFRDTLKVAEIVATRAAYLAAMSELLRDRTVSLTPEVMDECLLLADKSKALSHPWIAAEIEKQMAMSLGLAPVLAKASEVVGHEVADRAPREVGSGRVVSQNLDFTVQHTTDGEVVTHENRRLTKLPVVGENITVSYYRGSGQVVESLEKLKVSEPFIDTKSMDLAVVVVDGKGKEQMVLFNSMMGFKEFVQVHGLDPQMVGQAMDVRIACPKPEPVRAPVERVVQGAPYIEDESRCIGVAFMEDGQLHSALFADADAMERCAKEYGFDRATLDAAHDLEPSLEKMATASAQLSQAKADLGDRLYQLGYRGGAAGVLDGRTYTGKIVAESSLLVAQDTGRGNVVVHDLRALDKVVRSGETMTVKYENGRGQVAELQRGGQGVER